MIIVDAISAVRRDDQVGNGYGNDHWGSSGPPVGLKHSIKHANTNRSHS